MGWWGGVSSSGESEMSLAGEEQGEQEKQDAATCPWQLCPRNSAATDCFYGFIIHNPP